MAKEAIYRQRGDRMDYTAAADVKAGQVVLLTGRVGIAVTDIAKDAVGELIVEGVFECAAETGVEWSVGDTLYWDDTNANLTKTSTSNTEAGYAFAPKASAGTKGIVKLIG